MEFNALSWRGSKIQTSGFAANAPLPPSLPPSPLAPSSRFPDYVSPHLHHVTISGLSPGTVYSYKIGLEDLTVRTFTTGLLPGDFPAGGKPFVATFVGDIGTTSVRRTGAKRERERETLHTRCTHAAHTLHAPLPRARELALQEVAEATLVAYRMRLTPASQRQQPRLRFTICPFLVLTPFPPLFIL